MNANTLVVSPNTYNGENELVNCVTSAMCEHIPLIIPGLAHDVPTHKCPVIEIRAIDNNSMIEVLARVKFHTNGRDDQLVVTIAETDEIIQSSYIFNRSESHTSELQFHS